MRLCMILSFVRANGLNYLNDANIRFQQNLARHIDRLSVWLNQIVHQMVTQSHQKKIGTLHLDGKSSDDMDLLKMKRSSMDIWCRLIAATNQYQNTDRQIQCIDISSTRLNKNGMLDILNEMNRTKESLVACQDDFHTLQLIYNKYLVQKFDIPIEIAKRSEDSDETKGNSTIQCERIDQNVKTNIDEESKEYFGMRDVKNSDDTDTDSESADERMSRSDWQTELDNIDMKVTRSFFAPVLKQLKTKIDPIKSEMKEREMKFLMAKGIDREQIIEFNKNEQIQVPCSSDSDSDSADIHDIKQKSKPRPDRYNEMRTFLQQKQPIRIMPFAHLPPPPPSSSEDVLE